MLLYIITIFIFTCISFKKIKKNIYNISKILNKIEPKKIQPIIKFQKNIKEKKIKKNKKEKNRKIKNKDNNANLNIYSINNKKIIENKNNQMKDMNKKIKDFEINSLEYKEAFRLDKRNCSIGQII